MDDDVLLHDALIVIAPSDEGDPVPAPCAELLERVGKGDAVSQTLLIKAGDLLDLIVHTAEVHGLDVDSKFLAGGHVLLELDRAYLDYLAAEVDRQLIEHGGLGAHRLIPFQIHHNIIHSKNLCTK